MGQFKKGHIPWHKGRTGVYSKERIEQLRKAKLENPTKYWLGKKRPNLFSEEAKRKIGFTHLGEKNVNWKGDKVSREGLHDWVYYHRGVPKQCEHCGKKNRKEKGQWILDWANKSHNYKREVDDWLPLCLKCHRKYDKK